MRSEADVTFGIARNGKRAGAWIDECVGRQQLNGTLDLPVGFLVKMSGL